jgi:hypothetical protein
LLLPCSWRPGFIPRGEILEYSAAGSNNAEQEIQSSPKLLSHIDALLGNDLETKKIYIINEHGAFGGIRIGRGNRCTWRKLSPFSFCSP